MMKRDGKKYPHHAMIKAVHVIRVWWVVPGVLSVVSSYYPIFSCKQARCSWFLLPAFFVFRQPRLYLRQQGSQPHNPGSKNGEAKVMSIPNLCLMKAKVDEINNPHRYHPHTASPLICKTPHSAMQVSTLSFMPT